MWLLDANMDVHLVALLHEFGVRSEAATRRGWGMLENGRLVSVAAEAGFSCLLTQDRLFGESAAPALRDHPNFSIVLIRLPQKPWREYVQQFRLAWAAFPIQPIVGQTILWPSELPIAD